MRHTTAVGDPSNLYTMPPRTGEPLCAQCHVAMHRSELRVPPRRAVNRVGSPMPPLPVLRTWRCDDCGRQQPRVE